MKRTFGQRLSGFFNAETTLMTHPEFPTLTLSSKGNVFAHVINPVSLSGMAFETLAQGTVKVMTNNGKMILKAPESHIDAVVRILKRNDDILMKRVAHDDPPAEGWDTQDDFAATLSTGQVLIRVPHGAAPSDSFEPVDTGRVLICPADAWKASADQMREMNLQDREAVIEAQKWAKAVKDAKGLPFVLITDTGVRITVRDEHAPLVETLVNAGAKRIEGAVTMSRKDFIATNQNINVIMGSHEHLTTKEEQRLIRVAKAERQRIIGVLRTKGIDARQDPEWVLRDETGFAIFSVSKKATGLIEMLRADNAHVTMPARSDMAIVKMGHDAFTRITPALPMIRAEMNAVKAGADGDIDAMKARIAAEAKQEGRASARTQISRAKSSRHRGAITIVDSVSSSNMHDPLNPLNPIGIFQMSLWQEQGYAEGVSTECKSMGAKMSETNGCLSVEPASGGDSWSSGSSYDSSSSYGSSSSSYDSGSSSSSYDSGSSSSYSSD